MSIIRKIRIVKYWVKILETNNCVVNTLYDVMFFCKHEILNKCNWLCQVRKLLLSLGFGEVWVSQCVNNSTYF